VIRPFWRRHHWHCLAAHWGRSAFRSFVTKLEQDLSVDSEVWQREFVAYSLPERWARRLLRGPGQSAYYYRLTEFRSASSDAIRPEIHK
jgi:hypothetical protein